MLGEELEVLVVGVEGEVEGEVGGVRVAVTVAVTVEVAAVEGWGGRVGAKGVPVLNCKFQ